MTSKKGRQTRITLRLICEGCEGSEASTGGPYQFDEHKESNLRGEFMVI